MLRKLAGDTVYQRGQNYYNEGRVGELTIRGSQITTYVNGAEPYRVTLNHTAKIFDGSCDCPASDQFDFCKHCVAAGLSYYYQTQTNVELAESSPSQDKLLPFLQTLTKPELASELHRLIRNDPNLLDQWLLRIEIASDNLSVADIRKRITKAIPYKPSGLWRYREVASYFDQCEQALHILETPVLSMDGPSIAKLCCYALQRLEKTLESVDDSSGYRQSVERRLRHWFETALGSDNWSENQKSELITSMILDTKFTYDLLNLPEGACTQLGQAELEFIYRALAKNLQSLTIPGNKDSSDERSHYFHIQALLLARAKAQNDIETELEILVAAAVDTQQSIKLVNRCIELNRLKDAKKWLDYANKVETLTPYHQLEIEDAQIALWLAQGNFDDALSIQWERYAEYEDLRSLEAVLKTAAHLEQKTHWLEKAIDLLKAKISPDVKSPKNLQRAEKLVSIYLDNNDVNNALALANVHALHPSTLMGIVNAVPRHTDQTFELIERATNILVNLGNNEVYDRALTFLQKQPAKLTEDQMDQFNALIKRIYAKPENLRKTKFVKRLKSEFPFLIKTDQ